MSLSAEECLKYEAECLEMADDPQLAARRDELVMLARLWRELAIERIAPAAATPHMAQTED